MVQRPSSSARGLGAEFRRRREALPAPWGKPCPRCGEPMVEGQELDCGHEVDRALGGGESPLRWEHASCNRRAGGRLSQALEKLKGSDGRDDPPPSRSW